MRRLDVICAAAIGGFLLGGAPLAGAPASAEAAAPPSYRDVVLADQPRAYWRLGETATETVARDSSANGIEGTYRGTVERGVEGAVGDGDTAASFLGSDADGSAGNVWVDDRDGLDFGTDDFSVEFWIKTTVHEERTAVAKYDGTDPNWRITVTDDAGYEGTIRAKLSDPSTETAYSSVRVDDGRWHHVVVAFDRDFAVMVFVDGIGTWGPIGSRGDVSNAAPLRIGDTASTYQPLHGALDDVAVYPRALPGARVLAHYRAGLRQHDPISHYAAAVAADDPVGHWRLGEDSRATVAVDETGAGLDGRYKDTFPGSEGAITEDPDTSAHFTGEVDVSGDDVFVGDRERLDFGTDDFSVEAWVKTTRHGERPIVVKANDWSQAQWQLTVTDDTGFEGRPRLLVYDGVTAIDAYGPSRVDDGAWHHVLAVVDRQTGIHVYVDGVARTLYAAIGTNVSNTFDFRVGDADLRDPFDGNIDEVAVYRTALSAARATAHYRAGRALFSAASRYRDEVLLDRPSGYWRLGDGASDVAADASGNGFDGGYWDGARGGMEGALAGDSDGAATFPHPDPLGDAAEVEVDDRDLLDPDVSDFTVEAWVKTGTVRETEDRGIIAKHSTDDQSAEPRWEVTITNDSGYLGRARIKLFDGSTIKKAYGPPIRVDDGQWHHVAFVVDRDWGVHAYVDGVEEATSMPTPGPIASDAQIEIGDTDNDDGLHGELDEVAFYRHALSAERLGAHRSWAERYALNVTLSPLTATSLDPSTTVTPTDWGANVTTQAGGWHQPESYRWRFQLAANQRLQRLSSGNVAVVSDSDTEGDDDPPDDDYSDGEPDNPADIPPEIEQEDDPEGDDEPFEDDRDNADDEGGEDPTEPEGIDEADRALGALSDAQDEVDGTVTAVVIAPTAADNEGHPVPAALSVTGTVVTLTASHRNGAYAYPVTTTTELVEEAGDGGESDGGAGAPYSSAAFDPFAPVAEDDPCAGVQPSRRARIVTYNPEGWLQLLEAFKRSPTRCADYYIVIAPFASRKASVRPNVAREVCRANAAVASVGAKIYPVAEFHWTGWREWISANRSTWRRAGMTFRREMRVTGGYGREECPELGTDAEGRPRIIPEYWAINEVGSTFTVPARDAQGRITIHPREVRANVRNAVTGLFHGADGSNGGACQARQTIYPNCPGIPFVIDRGHYRLNFRVYRPWLKENLGLASDAPGFWNAMRKYVLFWSQETYVNCYKVCLAGYERQARSKHVNAFSLHPARLTYAAKAAGGTPRSRTAAARSLFAGRYMPLFTAYWGKLIISRKTGRPVAGYGQTDALDREEMETLVSLQIYSARRHATGRIGADADTASTYGRFPGPRIGFAWHEEGRCLSGADPNGVCRGTHQCLERDGNGNCIVDNPDYRPNETIANRIAQALQAAYSPGGTPAAACQPSWCGRVVSPSPYSKRAHRRELITCWIKNFGKWTILDSNGRPTTCNHT